MTRDKTIAIATNELGKCVCVAKVKHINEDEVAQYKVEEKQYGYQKQIDDIVSTMTQELDTLKATIEELQHEIKVLKGEEDNEIE